MVTPRQTTASQANAAIAVLQGRAALAGFAALEFETGDTMNQKSLAPSDLGEYSVTPKQAAELLRVSTSTLDKWRSTGCVSLPYAKISGRVMYRLSDVQDLAQTRAMPYTQRFA